MTNVIRSLGRRSSVVLLAAIAGLGAFSASPASAGFRIGIDIKSEERHRPREVERVWVPPVYRTECERVWIEPVYRCVEENVWVPERCEDQWVVRRIGWREHRERVHVVVERAHWEKRSRQVLVKPGHWEERPRQVLVSAGHWETRETRHDHGWRRDRDDHDDHHHGQVSIEIGRRW